MPLDLHFDEVHGGIRVAARAPVANESAMGLEADGESFRGFHVAKFRPGIVDYGILSRKLAGDASADLLAAVPSLISGEVVYCH